jgi:hypothetical protein
MYITMRIQSEKIMEISRLQLWLLRGMYLLLVIGQGVSIWPGIVFATQRSADSHTVVSAFLGALSLLALLGLRYPLKMLPLLLFELAWKAIWAFAFALPAWLGGGLDEYAKGVMFAVGLGLIITPLTIPWKYVIGQYLLSPSDSLTGATSARPQAKTNL